MDSEGAIMRDFLGGPLLRDQAIHRLIGLGYLQEDAEDLVDEWINAADGWS